MTYKTTIGITVFGEPTGYSADALISEFISFITTNSKFDVVVIVNKYPALEDDEFIVDTTNNCRYPTPWLLHADTKSKFPLHVQYNMILYDFKNYPVCFGGGMWGGDVGINGVPFIIIPLGAWPDVDNLPSCVNSVCSWNRALTQTLVHEWMHAIDYILNQLGFPSFPSIDTCTDYEYTGTNDPGWANCMKYFLSLLTIPMYEAIKTWNASTLNKEVQAYLPSYSPEDEYLSIQYNLVTAIIYSFMYINGDGSLIQGLGYSPDNLIAYAHARKVKVILSVQASSKVDADTMLASPTTRTTAINNIFNEVVKRGFDGVDNDIEQASHTTANKANITAFQTELANKLWGSNPNYRLSIAIGAYYPDVDMIFDVGVLQEHCNFIMIMGYDWYGKWSGTAGPNSPHLLDSGIGNFWAIKHYEELMDKSKLLIGVPYYGYEYATTSDSRLADQNGAITAIVYDRFIDDVMFYSRNFDNTWNTPWYTRQSGGKWYQGHYDDVQSLGQKYDVVNSEGLGGIGIWEISQGTSRTELWDLIHSKFAVVTMTCGFIYTQ
jgi:spore germination protein YaaH